MTQICMSNDAPANDMYAGGPIILLNDVIAV